MKKVLQIIPILIFIFVFSNYPFTDQHIKSIRVGNKIMRGYIQGSGNDNIVLLSGWGTQNPIDDFMPLINKLSTNFRVIALEYFGYGESDITENERSSKAIVE